MYVRRFTVFSTLHPVLLLFYAAAAPVCAMLGNHPAVLLCMFSCAVMIHIFYMGGKAALESIRGTAAVILVVMILNMLTNPMGTTELFKIGSRLFTLESLCYGLTSGGMLGTVILWFRCFTAIVPNDKFLYLFGRRFQTVALLLSMILKLFPETRYKIYCINLAQDSRGKQKKGTQEKRKQKGRLKRSMRKMSSLLEWSMEDGIETADSMKARGYGDGRRSSYQAYRFCRYDGITAVGMILLYAGVIITVLDQSKRFVYYPVMHWERNGAADAAGYLALVVFLLLPVWFEVFRKGGIRR